MTSRRWGRSRRRDEEDLPAAEWMHRGAELLDSDLDAAERCLRRALELDETLRGAWFDLGLVHKWRGEWARCVECNRRSAALPSVDDDPDPSYWNAGIAATAMSDWSTARWAWRGYGIPIADGEGPIREDFGMGPVRLPGGEVVWGSRIDPARVELHSVPLPESGFRCGDIVLHDGAPSGSRVYAGREYPVFDALSRWEASPIPTTEVLVDGSEDDIGRLMGAGAAEDVTIENWSASIVVHCAACSSGRVDVDHPDHVHTHDPSIGYTRLGISGDPGAVDRLLRSWESDSGGVVQFEQVHR